MINHYKVLNIREDATQIEIKKAFRVLALKLHPDKTKSTNLSEFLRVKSSYDILINKFERKIYDQQLYEWRHPKQKINEVNLPKMENDQYHNETVKTNILNFILRFIFVIIFISFTAYSCDFVKDIIFQNKQKFYNQTSNSSENNALYDSLKIEDLKIEKELQNTKEQEQSNGEITF